VPRRVLTLGVLCLAAVLAGGCSVRHPAPVSDRGSDGKPAAAKPSASAKPAPRPADGRPDFYTVRKGDTLFSIALDHGLDYRELAQWNGISDPGVIRIGQQLRLTPPGTVTAAPYRGAPGVQGKPIGEAPAAAASGVKSQPRAVRAPYSDQAYTQMSGAKPEPSTPARQEEGEDAVAWAWPVSGKVISAFNESANLKGIAIAGKLGQPVLASAPGRVIFSGTGIRGFGKLIVIKHNNTFLSVYAHNNELLVKEGQSVNKGQRIAEMGSTDTDQVKLHFEIRRYGKPVDPAKLLPPT
jgi:lipoprotein NlpD